MITTLYGVTTFPFLFIILPPDVAVDEPGILWWWNGFAWPSFLLPLLLYYIVID